MLEEITKLVLRIRDLRERIEDTGEKRAAWKDKVELAYLKRKLEEMKHRLVSTKEV